MKKKVVQGANFGAVSKHAGFSLVEMLMALLVASLLLAALAPVITKRYSDSVSVAGATGGGRAPAGIKCWNWEAKDLNVNGQRVVSDFALDEVWYANFILASGGAGGAGATVSSEAGDNIDSTNSTYTTTGLKITKDMDEFEITSLIGGGGGAGGGAGVFSTNTCTGSPSNTKCECMGATYDSRNNVCVTNNLGSKNLTNATSACSGLAPAGKYTLPTKEQLANWNTQYSALGIVKDQSVWSRSNAQGDCKTGGYSCYCKGEYRSGKASQAACCTSECTWGKQQGGTTTCGGSCLYRCGSQICDYTKSSCSYSSYCYKAEHASSCTQWTPSGCTWIGAQYVTSTADTCKSTLAGSCVEYYTNYYYYQLSGTSWSQTSTTANTDSRSTYCVYSDTQDTTGESFYSLSGGGGAGAPAVQGNNINTNVLSLFNSKVRENIDGYIVLEKGRGGQGGSGSSNKNQKASNGLKGEASCVAILDSSRKVQFRLCAPGGNFGAGADATKSDSSTKGYGDGGSETNVSNACYVIDYSEDATGIKTTFDCSNKGKGGSAGGASTANPTQGGVGGASVLNNITVSNNGKDGVTASSANYGAGGGGGTATKTGFGTSASLSFGSGGNGADGYIKLNFKHKYDGAGGGGGSAGTLAIVNNILVGKTATCTFKIGQGGSGGGIGADGVNGGNTSVVCSNDPTTYEVYGGLKGRKGTSAQSAGEVSTGGKGGNNTTDNPTPYSESIGKLVARSDASVHKGLDGTDGGLNDASNPNYTNYIQGEKSSGGRGGTSGTGKKGKCGGLQNDIVCSSDTEGTPTIQTLAGQGFSYVDIVEPTAQSISQANPTYGESSSGGGGGAWYQGVGSGAGGDGLGGFACVYWQGAE